MKVQCPKCNSKGQVPQEKIPYKGINVTCPQCKTKFFFKKTETNDNSKINIDIPSHTASDDNQPKQAFDKYGAGKITKNNEPKNVPWVSLTEKDIQPKPVKYKAPSQENYKSRKNKKTSQNENSQHMWLIYFIVSFIFGVGLLKSQLLKGSGVGPWIIVIIGALVGAYMSANILSGKK